jgi:nucleoside-diphosphate-sugar epimerase
MSLQAESARLKGRVACITGGTGFIGRHVIDALLRAGCQVRALVRVPMDHPKVRELLAAHPGALTVHSVDLESSAQLGPLLAGATDAVQLASPVPQGVDRDTSERLVKGAVRLTQAFVSAAVESGTVHSVVYMSSLAAAVSLRARAPRPITPDCWNPRGSAPDEAYASGKMESERCAVELCERNPGGPRLVRLLPGAVFGPSLSSLDPTDAGHDLAQSLLSGWPAVLPGLSTTVVDVRDVAALVVKALANAKASGRYLVSTASLSFAELGKRLRALAPPELKPRVRVASWMSYATLPMQLTRPGQARYLWHNLHRPQEVDTSRTVVDLGPFPRFPVEETLGSIIESLRRYPGPSRT